MGFGKDLVVRGCVDDAAAEVLGVGTDTATLFASQLLGFVLKQMLVGTYYPECLTRAR